MFTRYAIFYTLPPCPLADFGAAWLGWDVARGVSVEHPKIGGIDISAITDTPRKYGLHGTIKSPFRLADGTTEQGLEIALEALCRGLPPIVLAGLELATLGRFLALCPAGDAGPLKDVAAQVVEQLDIFRAPYSGDELARRRSANLTPEQEVNLQTWGYPHIMNAFRFHITLTGRLNKHLLSKVKLLLDPLIAPMLPRPFLINSLTLVGQRGDGMFEEINRHSLTQPNPIPPHL